MRARGPKLCQWERAPATVLVLLHLSAVRVPGGAYARQHVPVLWPHGDLHPPWGPLPAPQRLFAGEQLLELGGRDLRLARPADRRGVGMVADTADGALRPRMLCAAAQSDGVTGEKGRRSPRRVN